MGTFEHKDFQTKYSSKWTRQPVKAIETSSRRVAIGGNTCDNKAQKETSASKDWETIMKVVWIKSRTVIIILKKHTLFPMQWRVWYT